MPKVLWAALLFGLALAPQARAGTMVRIRNETWTQADERG